MGEGVAPWKEIVAAAEKVGGVEYYLIEQEGSRYPEIADGRALPEELERNYRLTEPYGRL
ncbi:MAG: hypothetical protein R2748_11980 [Bryobacterales bacterium]